MYRHLTQQSLFNHKEEPAMEVNQLETLNSESLIENTLTSTNQVIRVLVKQSE